MALHIRNFGLHVHEVDKFIRILRLRNAKI